MNIFDFDVVSGPSLQKRPACPPEPPSPARPRDDSREREAESGDKRTEEPTDRIASSPASG